MGEFLRSAFSALPTAASSPMALAGYVVTILAWVIIALKIKRNKQVLASLDKFPERDRLAALRLEMGTVRLKAGLSPQQYLKSRIHLYYLIGLGMVCILILLIFAISVSVFKKKVGAAVVDITLSPDMSSSHRVSKTEAAPSDSINIGVMSHNRRDPFEAKGQRASKLAEVKYAYERTEDKVFIKPVVPYLTWLRNGGVITGSGISLNRVYPKLSIKVVNNTEETIYLTEVVVTVNSSAIDKEPLLTVGRDDWDDLHIYNDGWGNVLNPRLSLGVADAKECGKLDPQTRPANHSLALNTFSTSIDVSMKPYVYVPPSEERKGNRVTIRPFPQTHTCAYGKIEYTTEDSAERAVWFKTTLWVGTQAPIPFEGVMPATAEYKLSLEAGLQINAGESGHIKRIPISQYVKPGEVDHFRILVVTDQSSMSNLSFDFLLADGKVLHSRDVILSTFVPRSWGAYDIEEMNKLK